MSRGKREIVLLLTLACATHAEGNRGKELFEKRCTGCHALDRDKAGPRLRGVYGRNSASASPYPYSDALRKANLRWDAALLEKWLAAPDELVPDNDMSFRLANAEERTLIVEYLRTLAVK